jgi:hypothetical protein
LKIGLAAGGIVSETGGSDMSVIPLFDLILDQLLAEGSSAKGARKTSRASRGQRAIVAKLVQAALVDLEQIRVLDDAIDRDVRSGSDRFYKKASEGIRDIYEKWYRHAKLVLERLDRIEAKGPRVKLRDQLRDEYGWIGAMLDITPQKIAHAMAQVRRGQVRTAKEVRDELRARVRR